LKYYPVYLNLKGHRVLLVGAGAVALQKIRPLLTAGARVHVVSPAALPEIRRLAQDAKIEWSARTYKSTDMAGVRLVIAATSDARLQKKIAKEAQGRGIWANVVDVPALCDFIAPAVFGRGDIQIAISTGGAAPALAKYLRRKLESIIGPEYEEFINVVQKLRSDILKLPKEKRHSLWERMVSDDFFQEIRTGGMAAAEVRLRKWIYGR
jgi:precorrin-2 dehydrogenase/sirohydrochlorin ferrochelatase